MKFIRVFNAQSVKIPHFKSLLTSKRARWPHVFLHFLNVHIMNVNYAKFPKKFDSRKISIFTLNNWKQLWRHLRVAIAFNWRVGPLFTGWRSSSAPWSFFRLESLPCPNIFKVTYPPKPVILLEPDSRHTWPGKIKILNRHDNSSLILFLSGLKGYEACVKHLFVSDNCMMSALFVPS